MSNVSDERKQQALAWLEQLSRKLDSDADMINAMPIDVVRAELAAMGADVEKFHRTLTDLLTTAELQHAKAIPINTIREELHTLGAHGEDFHAKLANTLSLAKLKQAAHDLIKWMSPLWQPQWAGQFVGAADIPKQHHTFNITGGVVEVACFWKPQSGETPSYLELSWKANTVITGTLWCRFVHPETQLILSEIPLGTHREGGKYLTNETLGFDPAREPWAISILIKEQNA